MTDWKRCQKAADDRFWGRLWWVPRHEAEARIAVLERKIAALEAGR
jgi:hypothetical protein